MSTTPFAIPDYNRAQAPRLVTELDRTLAARVRAAVDELNAATRDLADRNWTVDLRFNGPPYVELHGITRATVERLT